MTPTPAPSARESIVKMLDDARPELRYAYPRTFIVRQSYADGSCDIDPPPDAPELKALPKVPQWIAGSLLVTPAPGSFVLVTFRDALEARAVITNIGPQPPGAPVARKGDDVVRMAQDPLTGLVYVAANPVPATGHHYAALATTLGPPLDTFPGTTVAIGAGSTEVTSR